MSKLIELKAKIEILEEQIKQMKIEHEKQLKEKDRIITSLGDEIDNLIKRSLRAERGY